MTLPSMPGSHDPRIARVAAVTTMGVIAAMAAMVMLSAVMIVDLLLVIGVSIPSNPYIKLAFNSRMAVWAQQPKQLPAMLCIPLQTLLSVASTAWMVICCKHRLWLPRQAPVPEVAVKLAYICYSTHTIMYACHLWFTVITMFRPLLSVHHIVSVVLFWAVLQETRCICVVLVLPYWLREQMWIFGVAELIDNPTALHHRILFVYMAGASISTVLGYYLGVRQVVSRRLAVIGAVLLSVNYSFYCTSLKGLYCLNGVRQKQGAFHMLTEGQSRQQMLIEAGVSALVVAALFFTIMFASIERMLVGRCKVKHA